MTGFYNKLTEEEKQVCDLCHDWSICNCEECNLYINNTKEKDDKYEE